MFAYLDEIVEPTIKDFEEHPTSRRHAFLACVVTFHAIDYLTYPRKIGKQPGKKKGNLRKDFCRLSPDFQVVDDVAHAFKHVTTDHRNGLDLRNEDVIPRPPSFVGEMVVGLSVVGDTHGGVTIWRNHSVDLLGSVRQAVSFLRSQSKA